MNESRPLIDDTVESIREDDHKRGIREDGMLHITVELTIDGKSIYRKFRAEDVSHIDWNPNINDMADSILNPAKV